MRVARISQKVIQEITKKDTQQVIQKDTPHE
jgi:hypothetical protein